MVVFRGWRLFGIAGTIVVYVAGILLLSIISLQNSSQRRPRIRSLQDVSSLIIIASATMRLSLLLSLDNLTARFDEPPPKGNDDGQVVDDHHIKLVSAAHLHRWHADAAREGAQEACANISRTST